jgi:hypothetical protein
MSSTWKAAIGIFLVFALGCLSGALSTSIFFQQDAVRIQRNPEQAAAILEGHLTRRLDLDADQQAQIRQILTDYLKDRRRVQQQVQPEMQALNAQMMRQIRSVLHPDQLGLFRDNVADLRRRLAHTALRPAPPADPMPDSAPATNARPGTL